MTPRTLDAFIGARFRDRPQLLKILRPYIIGKRQPHVDSILAQMMAMSMFGSIRARDGMMRKCL